MRQIFITVMTVIIMLVFASQIQAQRFLNKLQDKTEDKIIDEIFKEDEKETPGNQETGKTATENTRG